MRQTCIHQSYEHQVVLLAASKKSLTVYMFCVRGFKSSERYFPTDLWVVPVVLIIG